MDLLCPAVEHTEEEIAAQKKRPVMTDYVYNPLRISRRRWPSRWIFIHDKEGTHESERYVLFTDDSVVKMAEDEFQKLLKIQKGQLGITEYQKTGR
jgi:hypothetical protein